MPTTRPFLLLLSSAFILSPPIAGAVELPVGANPPALQAEHFPGRLYAFVWRNWNLVEPARMARTIDTDVENIEAIAASLGLPAGQPIPPRFKRQIYITVLRRNWHLLPYDQLLTLLDMSAEELAEALREDDFLFIKLGSLKPRCTTLTYEEPNEAARHRTGAIKQLVERRFGRLLKQEGEPRFAFIEHMERRNASTPTTGNPARDRQGLRYIYSYFGVFGDPLSNPEVDPYPDALLAELARVGVNGVWLHTVLRQLAPGGEQFPEFGHGHEVRLANLRRLVERAKRHGIAVYLYMNEPRAMPVDFFQNRPELAGVREGDYMTLCTSEPRVRKWLADSLAHVFREVPNLGGVFTITASENLTNCASHGQWKSCPRCKDRSDADIIAEVNAAIAEGVHRGNPNARVIAWDWGWRGHGDASEVIARLPNDVWLMSVSEWSLPIERGGVRSAIGEYSISAVGPGPRATLHWKAAKQRGLQTAAKVQLNNTWELSAVPYLPVLDLVAEHCSRLAQADVNGMMLSWSLGGYPSPNLQVSQKFAEQPKATVDEVLDDIARARYGERAVPKVRQAWTHFSTAFRQFPYDGSLVYKAPQQFGPANLLYARPTGYASTMIGFPYDDLNGWRNIYPAEVFAGQFEKVAAGWSEGLGLFKQALEEVPPDRREVAEGDWRVAVAARLHFASVANQARFIIARDALSNDRLPPDERKELRRQILETLDAEAELATALFEVAHHDSRIGFEASNHYYYVPQDLIEKVINCEHLRQLYEERD